MGTVGTSHDQANTKVIQEIDEDEGYDSIASKNNSEADQSASKHIRKRRKTRQEDLKIVEGDSKETLIEKFLLLRDAYAEKRVIKQQRTDKNSSTREGK